MSSSTCGSNDEELEGCRDDTYAVVLKMIAIAAILVSGSCGVAIPLFGKKSHFLHNDSSLFVAAKAFAAGVILATGFVHMLPDATEALTDSCLPEIPWSKFPFSGFIAMMAALATSLADLVGTRYHKRKQEKKIQGVLADSLRMESEPGINETRGWNGRAYREEEGDAIQIVAMDADAAHHTRIEPHEQGECEEMREHSHCRSHWIGTGHGNEEDQVRHIVASQVLELGIVSHSAIIGLSLGVSHSPCVVRPLIAALSFHQFFEGLALGSCISQAKFKTLRSVLMACFFSLTTPIGIAVGIGISSIYNASSPKALITEGILDSISAGILVYMALVDLIAAEFLNNRKGYSQTLQLVSYISLILGAVSMSALAIWA